MSGNSAPPPRPADPSKAIWTANRQYIDITVKVIPAGVTLPANARVIWESDDPDDTSNEDSSASEDAKRILDPNDYDSQGQYNPNGDDNTTNRDNWAEWEELHPDYALSGSTTALKDGLSRVRFNATDAGGDNFRISARLRIDAIAEPCQAVRTGIFTLWHRISIEKGKMTSVVNDVDTASLAQQFHKAFVQLDFDLDTPLADQPGILIPWGALDYCTSPRFTKEGVPGWFFLASALTAGSSDAPTEVLYPQPTEDGDYYNQCSSWGFEKSYVKDHDGETLYASMVNDEGNVRVTVYDDELCTHTVAYGSGSNQSTIRLREQSGSGCSGSVRVDATQPVSGSISLVLRYRGQGSITGNTTVNLPNLTERGPEFITIWSRQGGVWKHSDWSIDRTEDDGSGGKNVIVHKKKYGLDDPNTSEDKGLVDMGLTAGSYDITVESSGGTRIGGIATFDLAAFLAGAIKFNGRIILFTEGLTTETINAVAAHECTHSFGMAHNCGYKDWRGKDTCCMTYDWFEPRREDGSPVLWFQGIWETGLELCPRHIQAIRGMHLEQEGSGLKLGW